MKCGHCKTPGVDIPHVKACAGFEQSIRLIGQAPAAAPNLATLANSGVDIEGVYLACDASTPAAEVSYYKVQQSPNTGNVYAKRWNGGGWDYEGRKPLYFITADDKIDAVQAARFGKVTGQCVFCSRKLTDERSIEVGYGPICAEHNGLPWGEVAHA